MKIIFTPIRSQDHPSVPKSIKVSSRVGVGFIFILSYIQTN